MSSPRQRQLTGLFAELNEQDQKSLIAFAEFLHARDIPSTDQASVEAAEFAIPFKIDPVDKESVVAAMKRLSKSYPMLNKDDLLHQASALMGDHIMRGKAAADVILELEALFSSSYDEAKKAFEEEHR